MHWAGYLWRRLLTTLTVLLGIVMITYALSRLADADPVQAYLMQRGELDVSSREQYGDAEYRAAARALGADLPAFFFGLLPDYYPDTLHRVLPLARRQEAAELLDRGCSWTVVEGYQQDAWSAGVSPSERQQSRGILQHGCASSLPVATLPRLVWYGADNGAVHFVRNLLKGKLGHSSVNGEPVGHVMWRALRVTLPIGLLALLLSVLLATLAGVRLARFDSAVLRAVLFVLVSAPGFWLATLLVTQLSGRGRPFPGPGWREAETSLATWLAHAALPLAILVIPAAAYLALLLAEAMRRGDRRALRDVSRLQGVSEPAVWWRDILPLGMVPTMTTAVGLLIPSFIGGFVVVEYVFNIPGLGRLVFESILARDWTVVLGVVLLSGLATVLGYLFIDVANALLDPRFRKYVTHVT